MAKKSETGAADALVWTQRLQHAQLKLRCAEIVYASGSQQNKIDLESEADRIYNFAMGIKPDTEK